VENSTKNNTQTPFFQERNEEIQRKVKLCGCTEKILKKTHSFICELKNKRLSLHRYPENNLFTLKELIPIED
jgi:hypothetical protein